MALCGGYGAAGPAAGGVSALSVGADVGVRDVGVYFVGVKPADEGVVCGGMVEIYPTCAGMKDDIGVFVGGEGVYSDAGMGVFEDEIDKALRCGGVCLVGVHIDMAGDDCGGSTIAGQR